MEDTNMTKLKPFISMALVLSLLAAVGVSNAWFTHSQSLRSQVIMTSGMKADVMLTFGEEFDNMEVWGVPGELYHSDKLTIYNTDRTDFVFKLTLAPDKETDRLLQIIEDNLKLVISSEANDLLRGDDGSYYGILSAGGNHNLGAVKMMFAEEILDEEGNPADWNTYHGKEITIHCSIEACQTSNAAIQEKDWGVVIDNTGQLQKSR